MSCGLRDVVNLEQQGRPSVLVHTEAFQESALRQTSQLGQPAIRRVVVPHPVQDRTDAEIRALAHGALEEILGAFGRRPSS